MKRFISILLLVVCLFSTISINVYADTTDFDNKLNEAYLECVKSGGNPIGSLPAKDYSGMVNVLFNDPNATISGKQGLAEVKVAIWQDLLSYGISKEGAAGIMGNMAVESGFDPTRTNSNVEWSQVTYGKCALGLTQWYWWSRQYILFRSAEVLSSDWLDLGVQLQYLRWEITQNKYVSYEEFKSIADVNNATSKFYTAYENPGIGDTSLTERCTYAQEIYSAFKDIEGAEFGGAQSAITEGSEVNEKIKNNSELAEEWALVGMPEKSKILESQADIKLPNRDGLSIKERYAVTLISDSIQLEKQAKVMDNIRTFMVFIGLIVITYGVLLLVAMIFDRVNVFIDVSLISLITMGRLKYSAYEDESVGKNGVSNTKKIVISSVVVLGVGLLILSGGILQFMSNIVYWVSERYL